jgi:hypothetical protein
MAGIGYQRQGIGIQAKDKFYDHEYDIQRNTDPKSPVEVRWRVMMMRVLVHALFKTNSGACPVPPKIPKETKAGSLKPYLMDEDFILSLIGTDNK